MQADDAIRIHHMIEAAQAALRFVEGRTREDIDSDEMLRFALVRAVEIVGEAASQVSADSRMEMSQIPWSLIIGTRNRLVHAYSISIPPSCGRPRWKRYRYCWRS